MPINRRRFLTAAGAGALAAGWAPGAVFAGAGALSVVATTGMIADTARHVGADLVSVKALMGPGVDPHAYRQTRTDITAMARADIVLWNGLYLEAQMEDVLAEMASRTPVAAVAEAVPGDLLIAHDDYADRLDPHVWMDPALWAHAVDATAGALADIAPESRAAFETNAAAFNTELAALRIYSETVLGSVAPEARVLLTAHDAFNYFGRAYGFEVIGVQGISTESEAGLSRISELVDILAERRIGAVFVESSVSDRSVKALIEGARSRGHEVRVGGELYSDAMGPPGSYEGTYVGMIDHNVTTIARALGGEAPARGMSGRLAAGS